MDLFPIQNKSKATDCFDHFVRMMRTQRSDQEAGSATRVSRIRTRVSVDCSSVTGREVRISGLGRSGEYSKPTRVEESEHAT